MKLAPPLGHGPSEILPTFPAICLQEGAGELQPGAQNHPHVYRWSEKAFLKLPTHEFKSCFGQDGSLEIIQMFYLTSAGRLL